MALKGNLSDVHITDLIQLNCQSGARARLTVQPETGGPIVVYFEGGDIVHATWGDVQGAEAIYALLSWESGAFETQADAPAPARTITLPWTALMMEGMRRVDERRAAQSIHETEPIKEQQAMSGETRRDRLAKTLRNLIDTSGDVSGVAVVSRDGLIMAADLPSTVEQARVGAVAAAILSLSGRSVGQLKRGELTQTTIQGSEGYIVITQAGPNAVLVALTGQGVNLGMVFLEVSECASALAEILG
jgi:hypothetical protein